MASETVTVLLYDTDPSTPIETGNNGQRVDDKFMWKKAGEASIEAGNGSQGVDEKFIWKESTTDKLLQLYKANPCLYDSKCKDYHNRDTKKRVLEEVARSVGVNSELSGQLS